MAVEKDKKTGNEMAKIIDEAIALSKEDEPSEEEIQKIRKKLKRVLIVAALLFAAVVVGRIIYVNYRYPSTKIHMLNQNQKFTGREYEMAVNDAVIYSREQWIDYLKKNVPADEELNWESYNYILGDNEACDIICIELSITNKTWNSIDLSNIMRGLILMSDYQSADYIMFMREQLDNSQIVNNNKIEAGQTKKFVCAYVQKDGYKQGLMLQYCELGNNQRMRLDIRETD